MKKYVSKKIKWDDKYWVQVRIYADRYSMCEDYKKLSPDDDTHNVLGVSINREHYHIPENLLKKYHAKKMTEKDWSKLKRENQTGIVMLCYEQCGAGIATHELMHASIFAYQRFIRDQEQYPFVLNNMEEEEILLRLFTKAVSQFYTWFWKVDGRFVKE